MRSLVRLVVLAGGVVLCLAAFSGSAAASAHLHRMLSRYQPVTVVDTHESFVPTSVEAFIRDATLETQTAPNTWAVVDSSPSATGLPTSPTPACAAQALVPCYRLNQQACTPATGVTSVSCYVTNSLDPEPRSLVYGRATRAGSTTILQYWYFYYDDFYSYNYPPDDFIWQAHEGDWEAVTILVPRGADHPRWIGYSQHCTGERRSWSDTPRWHGSTHPVVDVGIGSHANFFTVGRSSDRGAVHPAAGRRVPSGPGARSARRSRPSGPGLRAGACGRRDADRGRARHRDAARVDALRRHLGRVSVLPRPQPDQHGRVRVLPGHTAGRDTLAAPGTDGSQLAAERLTHRRVRERGSRERLPLLFTVSLERRLSRARRSAEGPAAHQSACHIAPACHIAVPVLPTGPVRNGSAPNRSQCTGAR